MAGRKPGVAGPPVTSSPEPGKKSPAASASPEMLIGSRHRATPAVATPPPKPAATTSPRKSAANALATPPPAPATSTSPTGSPVGSRVDSPGGSGFSSLSSSISPSGSVQKRRHVTVKQGEVWKLMDDEKTWKKRFLVITERSLYFYKSSLKESEPKPIKISLTRIDRVHEGQKRRNSLLIVTPNRSYEFYVVETGEFKEWNELLREIAQQKRINREPTPETVQIIVEELKDIYPAGTSKITADQLGQLPLTKLEQIEARLNRDMEAEISAQWTVFEQKRDQLLDELCRREIRELRTMYAEQVAEIEQEIRKRKPSAKK